MVWLQFKDFNDKANVTCTPQMSVEDMRIMRIGQNRRMSMQKIDAVWRLSNLQRVEHHRRNQTFIEVYQVEMKSNLVLQDRCGCIGIHALHNINVVVVGGKVGLRRKQSVNGNKIYYLILSTTPTLCENIIQIRNKIYARERQPNLLFLIKNLGGHQDFVRHKNYNVFNVRS